jgi:thermitase
MKQHLKVQLREGAALPIAPSWHDVALGVRPAAARLQPDVDRILAAYHVPVLVTSEYAPAGGSWSPDEIATGLDRVYRLVLVNDQEIPAEMIEQIRLLPVVSYVHIGAIGQADLPVHEQSYTGERRHMRSREEILLPEAHALTQGSPDVTVAVLDTGVCLQHPELTHALLPGYDFVDIIDGASSFIGDFLGADPVPDDEVGHGTHVAGIIAARGLRMPVGVAPRCKLLPVRVLGAMERDGRRVGAGLIDNINSAVKWAVDHGADVINMSLGVRHEGGGVPHAEVIDYARRKGVTVVAASGNGGGEDLFYPGALPHVITVGAHDDAGEVAAFSSYGKQVSLVAPGTDIFSAYLGNAYALSSGTSHAAPFVAGAAALLRARAREQGHRLRDAQVKYALQQSADRVGRDFKDLKAGYGRLNVRDALRLLDYRLGANGTSGAHAGPGRRGMEEAR